jgi:hypothetical protein
VAFPEMPEFSRIVIEMTDAPMQRLHQRARVMPFTKRSVYEWVSPPGCGGVSLVFGATAEGIVVYTGKVRHLC